MLCVRGKNEWLENGGVSIQIIIFSILFLIIMRQWKWYSGFDSHHYCGKVNVAYIGRFFIFSNLKNGKLRQFWIFFKLLCSYCELGNFWAFQRFFLCSEMLLHLLLQFKKNLKFLWTRKSLPKHEIPQFYDEFGFNVCLEEFLPENGAFSSMIAR